MTYQVLSSEIAISYNNTTYVVMLGPASDPGGFQVQSSANGNLKTVAASTAAKLLGVIFEKRDLTEEAINGHVCH